MYGIHLDVGKLTQTDPKENLFELRQRIYNSLLDAIFNHIDYLYQTLATENKIKEIEGRSIKSKNQKESLVMLYKGIEIPLITKTGLILDNIQYIPVFQSVDRCIHLQKDGKYIVVKNNIRNTFLKLDGKKCIVLTKNAKIPLLAYLLYVYPDVRTMLTDFGFTIEDSQILDNLTDEELSSLDKHYYIVPEYYENTFLLVKKDFEPNGWKEYFLSPFTTQDFELHQMVCNNAIDAVNSNIIPEITENGKIHPCMLVDEKKKSALDDIIEENRKRRENLDIRNTREYILLVQHRGNTDIEISKLYNIINMYHNYTRTTKRNLTRVHLEGALYKYNCKDITMHNVSVFDMLIENIKNNIIIPECYNIADISQKDLRYMEWLALRLSSAGSYPESNVIMEIAKTEQRRIYNNAVNPITELCMMSRVNLYGRGSLPIESCNAKIRNAHESYLGVIDNIDSASGRNIGIALHLVPEINDTDMRVNVERLRDGNIINILYKKQFEVERS